MQSLLTAVKKVAELSYAKHENCMSVLLGTRQLKGDQDHKACDESAFKAANTALLLCSHW